METGSFGVYGAIRTCMRVWFGQSFRRIRVLREESLPDSGPALLVVNHPPSFVAALSLVSALSRPVRFMMDRSLLRAPAARFLANGLGMICYEGREDDWAAALEAACRALGRNGTVAVFTRPPSASNGEFAPEAVDAVLEAESYLGREVPVPVFPVHIFSPSGFSSAGELLVYVDNAIPSATGARRSQDDFDAASKKLDEALEQACCAGPFRLQPEQVEEFVDGLETVMREDFAESWTTRANWRQKVEDFDLSPHVIRVTHRLNYVNPGRLASLNEALRNYEERKRVAALDKLRAAAAGGWIKSGGKRFAIWMESICGFPIALYGLINLLAALFILRVAGLLKKRAASPAAWTARILIALGCYAGQIALAAHFLSRATAGYYAPSLILSGAYLLRYAWLFRNRTRILMGATGGARRAAAIRRLRKALIAEIERDQAEYLPAWRSAR